MEAASQLNVRIDSQVKEAGELSIRAMGVTVTVFMRRLWDKLAQGGEACDAIRHAVLDDACEAAEDSASSPALSAQQEALAHARTLRDQWMAGLGYDADDLLGDSPYDVPEVDVCASDRALAYDALVERMRERGTW